MNLVNNKQLSSIDSNEMKSSIFFLIGVPASGKSTYCRKHFKKTTVLSSDDIRENLYGQNYNNSIEKNVSEILIQKALSLVKQHKSIALDTTYFNTKEQRSVIINKIIELNFFVEIIAIYFNTPVELCLKRNQLRKKNRILKDETIHRLHKKIEYPEDDELFSKVLIVS